MVSGGFSMAPVSEGGRQSFPADSETQRHLKTKCHFPKCSGDEIDAPSHLPVSCHVSSDYGGGVRTWGRAKGGSTHLHTFQGRGAAELASHTGPGRLLR